MKLNFLLGFAALLICSTVAAQFGPQQLIHSFDLFSQNALSADWDGDGDNDVLLSSQFASRISWLENDGNGTFGSEKILWLSEEIVQMEVADMDGDGDLDLPCVFGTSNVVCWLENDGTGVLLNQNIVSSELNGAIKIDTGDFNNDGFNDIVVAHSEGAQVGVYLNDLAGGFSPISIIANEETSVLQVVDINGDNDLDVVYSASSGEIKTAIGDGFGNFGTPQTIISEFDSISALVAGNINGDQYIDIAVSTSDQIFQIINDGSGGWNVAESIGDFDNAIKLKLADANNDEAQDLVVAAFNDSSKIYLNTGSGFLEGNEIGYLESTLEILVVDLNSDDAADVLLSIEEGLIWYSGASSLQPFESTGVIGKIQGTGDFNGDDELDLVHSVSGDLYWTPSQGNGEYGEPQLIHQLDVGVIWDCIVADADEDGDLDIFWDGSDHTVGYLENTGAGASWNTNAFVNQETSNGLQYLDLDNDGDLDLVAFRNVPFWDVVRIFWWENLGSGNYATEDNFYEDDGEFQDLVFADFDEDGDLDYVISHRIDQGNFSYIGDVVLFENNGSGTFFQNEILEENMNAYPTSLEVLDINQDDLLDVVCMTSHGLKYFLNSDTGFSEPIHYTNSVYSLMEIAKWDYDNDGDFDLLIEHNDIFLLENTAGDFAPQMERISFNGASSFEIVDLDENGYTDLIVGFSDIGILYNDGTPQAGSANFLAQELDLPSEHIGTFDFSGDGHLDFLFSSRNDIVMHWNDGQQISEEVLLQADAGGSLELNAADLDADGLTDLLWSTNLEGISWQRSLGNGDFEPPVTIDTDGQLFSSSLVDVDGDEDLDLVYIASEFDADSFAHIYLNSGGGASFDEIVVNLGDAYPRDYLFFDFNVDGMLDLLHCNNDDEVLWQENLGGGNYASPAQIISDVSNPDRLLSADFNGDEIEDLIVSENAYLNLYLHDGSTLGAATNIIVPGANHIFELPFDVDLDGDLDLLTSDLLEDYQFGWLENDGEGNFPNNHLIDEGSIPTDLKAHDVDADGSLDIYATLGAEVKYAWYESVADSPYQASGTQFWDENENGDLDASEEGVNIAELQFNSTEANFYSGSTGEFNAYLDLGSHSINADFDDAIWELTTNSSLDFELTELDPTEADLNFGFIPVGEYSEVQPSVVSQFPRCNWEVGQWVTASNLGNQFESGVLCYQLDPLCEFVSSEPIADSIVGQSAYFSFDDLLFTNEFVAQVVVQMPSVDFIGAEMTHVASVYLEDDFGNLVIHNTSNLDQILQCAYDPNIKEEHNGVGPDGYIPPNEKLDYTIHFQNTGTDTAFNISIIDRLPSLVNPQSIQVLGSSHDMYYELSNDTILVFYFDNIQLPDSNINETLSHGFVSFSIDQDLDLEEGERIYNTAEIYFDLNPPIITNTTLNVINSCALMAQISPSLEELSICEGQTIALSSQSPTGNTWFLDGVEIGNDNIVIADSDGEYELVVEIDGCPETSDTIEIATIESPSTPSITETDGVLSADVAGMSSYSWYLNDELIFESDQAEFSPTESGDYYVVVTNSNGCSSISSTFNFVFDSIEAIVDSGFTITPNPASHFLSINHKMTRDTHLEFWSSDGKLVREIQHINPITRIDISDLATGNYTVHLFTSTVKLTEPLIILPHN